MAFAMLFHRYDSRLVAFLTRYLGDRAQAEDVAQETFADAWQARERFDSSRRPFRVWLYALAKNAARSEMRRRARAARLVGELAVPSAPVEADHPFLSHVVSEALLTLPESQRLAIALTVYEGCSHREAAQVLGSNELAIRVLCHRARQNLKKRLASILEGGLEERYV